MKHPDLETPGSNSKVVPSPQPPSGWWLTYPSEKYDFVNWDDDIPNIWKIKVMFQTTKEFRMTAGMIHMKRSVCSAHTIKHVLQ